MSEIWGRLRRAAFSWVPKKHWQRQWIHCDKMHCHDAETRFWWWLNECRTFFFFFVRSLSRARLKIWWTLRLYYTNPLMHRTSITKEIDKHIYDLGFCGFHWMWRIFDVPFPTLLFYFGVRFKNPPFVASNYLLQEIWVILKMIENVLTVFWFSFSLKVRFFCHSFGH